MFTRLIKYVPKRPVWTRATVDPDDLREYDAFGPWMLAIRSLGDMPPRFRSVYDRVKDATFLIKIPRAIDRRDAYPGCDLYSAVFAADVDGFTLLTADEDGDGFNRREVVWDDVAATRVYQNLLRAEFVLLLKEGDAVSLSYNAVSSEVMVKVMAATRQWLINPADSGHASGGEAEEIGDFFFSVMLAEERRGGHFMLPIHFEEQGKACRDIQNRRRLTTGLMILLSGDELVVIDRDIPMRRRFFAHYASRKTYISLSKVKSYRLLPRPSSLPSHFMVIEFMLDQQRISVPCFKPPDRVVEALRRRGVPQH